MKTKIILLFLLIPWLCKAQYGESVKMKNAAMLIDSIIQYELAGRTFNTHVVWSKEQFDEQNKRYLRLSEQYFPSLLKLDLDTLPDIFIVYYASIITKHCDIREIEKLMINNIFNSKPVFVQFFSRSSAAINQYLASYFYSTYRNCSLEQIGLFSMKSQIDRIILYNDTIPAAMRELMLHSYIPDIADRDRLLTLYNRRGCESGMALATLTRLNQFEDLQTVDSLIQYDSLWDYYLSIAIANPNPHYYQTVLRKLEFASANELQESCKIRFLAMIYSYFAQIPSDQTRHLFEENLSRKSGMSMKERKLHRIALTIALEEYPDPLFAQIQRKYRLKYSQWMDMYMF